MLLRKRLERAAVALALVFAFVSGPSAFGQKGKPGGEEILGEGPDQWEVKADPPAKPVPLIDKDVTLRVPPSFFGGEVTYPSAPSVFVAVGRNNDRNDVRQVWDLAARKRVGMLRGDGKIDKPFALSADGSMFAGKMGGGGKGFAVFETKAGRIVGSCPTQSPFADYVDFADANTLITGVCNEPVFQVWDLKARRVSQDIRPPNRIAKESVKISPGGKYIAMTGESKLFVYEIATGKLAGEANIPKQNNFHELHCKALAFSPDGAELAGVFDAFGTHLLCWDATTGSVTSRFDYDDKSGVKAPFGSEVGVLEWLGDKSGWLVFGSIVIDHQSGQKIFTIPSNTANSDKGPRRVVGNNLVLITVGEAQNRMVRSFRLPKDMLANAAKIVREGGSAADAALPPLKSVDLASVRRVTPESRAPAWSAAPDPAGAGKGTPRRSISLRSQANEPLRVLFSDPASSIIAVVNMPGGFNAFDPNQNEGKSRLVDRYDLVAGKFLGRTELPGIVDPIAVSPEGTRVLMVDTKERGRVDLFDMAANRHLAGWRPFDKESGEDKGVVWAGFLANDKVLTVNKAGTLILWSVPDCKAVYLLEGACEGTPALSPGRKLLAAYLGGTVRFLDPATGATKGEGETPASAGSGKTQLKALTFSADGAVLAALVNDDQLVRWDVKSGKVTADLKSPVPVTAFPNSKNPMIECCGTQHVLLDGRVLIDLEHQAHVWSYFGGELGTPGTDGRHWYVQGIFNQPAVLRTIVLPEPNVGRVVAMVNDPNVKAMLRVGSKVSVQLEATPARDPEAFRKAVTDQLNAKLRANGMKTGDGGPLWLIVHIDERDTGQTIMYRNFGDSPFAPPRHQMSLKMLDCEIQLADAQERIPVVPKQSFPMPSPHFLRMPANETSVEGYLRKLHWDNMRGYVSGIGLPYFVAKEAGGIAMLPGVTNLNAMK